MLLGEIALLPKIQNRVPPPSVTVSPAFAAMDFTASRWRCSRKLRRCPRQFFSSKTVAVAFNRFPRHSCAILALNRVVRKAFNRKLCFFEFKIRQFCEVLPSEKISAFRHPSAIRLSHNDLEPLSHGQLCNQDSAHSGLQRPATGCRAPNESACRNVSKVAKWPGIASNSEELKRLKFKASISSSSLHHDRNTDRRNLYLGCADNNSCKWPVRTQNSSSNANPDIRPEMKERPSICIHLTASDCERSEGGCDEVFSLEAGPLKIENLHFTPSFRTFAIRCSQVNTIYSGLSFIFRVEYRD